MDKYVVRTPLTYEIVLACSPSEAFIQVSTENFNIRNENVFWDKEELRQHLLKCGLTTMTQTNIKGVYELN